MNSKIKGYALGIIGAASYGTNPLFALPLYERGMDADTVLLMRYALSIPIVAAMIAWRGRSFRVRGAQLLTLTVLGLLMSLSSLALFVSYNYMDAGIASTLLFVYPIMVAVIMAGVYHEKISGLTAGCIATALAGIAMLYNGEGEASLNLTGTLLVMGSSLSYAIYMVAVNRKSLKNLASLTVTLYVLLAGIMLFVARLLMKGEPVVMPTGWLMWGCVAGLAVLPTAVSFICTTGAIQYIGATPTAIIGAMEPVTAVIIGVTVFHEALLAQNVIGLILIVVAVTGVVGGKSITRVLTHRRRMFPRLRRK